MAGIRNQRALEAQTLEARMQVKTIKFVAGARVVTVLVWGCS